MPVVNWREAWNAPEPKARDYRGDEPIEHQKWRERRNRLQEMMQNGTFPSEVDAGGNRCPVFPKR